MSRRVVVGCDLFLPLRLYRVPPAQLARLRRRFPSVEFVPVNLPGRRGPVGRVEVYWGNRVTPELIAAMPRLRWIHFGSVGVNRALTPETAARRIAVTNSPRMMSAAVASTAMALLTSLARGLHRCWRLREDGKLTRARFDAFFEQVHDLEGQRCLVAGVGDVGGRVAAACRALGMTVEGVSASGGLRGGVRTVPLSRLGAAVAKADFVVNLLPLTARTRGAFSRRVLGRMKRSAFFVNVGRGETVDEGALIGALRRRRIAGAGLDVFAKEPLAADSPLWSLDNVILLPHIGGLSRSYWDRQVSLLTDNLGRYLKGRPLRHRVDLRRGY
jgi:phosphoglycerate dehydrogenase-like enzyme